MAALEHIKAGGTRPSSIQKHCQNERSNRQYPLSSESVDMLKIQLPRGAQIHGQ